MKAIFATKVPYKMLSMAIIVALSGCSEGENTSQADSHKDGHPHHTVMSRFAITELDSNALYVLDGNQFKTLQQFTLSNSPSALKTSPNGRYALAMQRMQDRIDVIDSGINAEAHGDHFHLHAHSPKLLTVSYDGIRPTHYDLGQGVASVFYDGNGAAGQNAKFQVVNDTSIAQGTAIAEHKFAYAVHGTAQIIGDYAFTGVKDPAQEGLPSEVVLLKRHHDHFHSDKQFAAQECLGLHGSAQSKTQLAFGCTDGVVHISINGSTITPTKIPNPTELAEDARIGTIWGFPTQDKLLAYAGRSQQVFAIQDNKFVEVKWQQSEDEKAQLFSQSQDGLIILSTSGQLHLFSAADGFSHSKTISLWDALPKDDAKPSARVQIAEDKRTGQLIVTDPINNELLQVNPKNSAVVRHPLSFSPNLITWVGTTEEEYHH